MKKYLVQYGRENTFGFASETIEARGIMHAFKLANAHLKDIRKSTNTQDLYITQINEVDEHDKE